MIKLKPPAPSAPKVPLAQPATAPVPSPQPQGFGRDEMSTGRGSALRARATWQLGAPPATSLATEDADDTQVNCLDLANDHLEALPPEQRAQAEVIFLDDTRTGVEGVDGHVLVKLGGQFIDPVTGQAHRSLVAFDPEGRYAPRGTVNGQQLVAILDTAPGSAERAAALEGVPRGLATMLVADDTREWTPPATAANPDRLPYLRVTSANGLNFRSAPNTDSRILGPLVQGVELRLVPPPEGVTAPEGWAYVEVDGRTGWVWAGADAVTGSDGRRQGMPYQDDTELGVTRDGSPASAVEWGRAWLEPAADAFVDADGNRMEPGYADACLRFVMKAYGAAWGENSTRSPHLNNPRVTGARLSEEGAALSGLYDGTTRATTYALHEEDGTISTGTAFGAYTSLSDADAMLHVTSVEELMALDPRPPEGAMIFFAPTLANGGAGHIALLTWKDGQPYVLSSGTRGDAEVREVPLADMIAWTGPLIGVADMSSAETINPNTLPVDDPEAG